LCCPTPRLTRERLAHACMSQREHGAWSCDFANLGKYDEYENAGQMKTRDDLIGSLEGLTESSDERTRFLEITSTPLEASQCQALI
jgi:hypothetical protein